MHPEVEIYFDVTLAETITKLNFEADIRNDDIGYHV